jgi:hypothetical protein
MAILEGDIKLLKSAVLDDVPEGGGMATGLAVIDGVSNNLFPDISELDRTYGRIALRKVFPAVLTDTVDGYYGAHVIVAQAPADPRVSAALFTTRSWSDVRTSAQNKLESYLALGAETRFILYGNHLVGQRQRAGALPPLGGDARRRRRVRPGAARCAEQLPVRARDPDHRAQCRPGVHRHPTATTCATCWCWRSPTRCAWRFRRQRHPLHGRLLQPGTRVHATFAADATSYYGVAPLAQAAYLGDLTCKASTVYTQLVPSALSEAPIIDARCIGDRELIVPIAGAPALSFTSTVTTSPGQVAVRYFGVASRAGRWRIAIGGVTLVDDSNGALVPTSGYTGSVDYASGAVSVARNDGQQRQRHLHGGAGGGGRGRRAHESTPISDRQPRLQLRDQPLAGAGAGLGLVDYMALGKWYRLVDNGAGGLSGDDGVGTGMVDYATGSLVVTLGALPDVNTEILYAGARRRTTRRTSAAACFRRRRSRSSVPAARCSRPM